MTYLTVNLLVLALAAGVSALLLARLPRRRPVLIAIAVTAAVSCVFTAVFDSVIVGVGLVAYDPDLISGILVGLAPIEDFAYTLLAALLLPALWVSLGRRRAVRDGDPR